MKKDVAIEIINLNKTYKIRENKVHSIREFVYSLFSKKGLVRELKVLNNITFTIKKGERLGFMGNNGAGKSTLFNCIISSLSIDKGSIIRTNGKILRLTLGMGFDGDLSARENIYINGAILGLTFKKIGLIFDDIIDFAGLKDFIDTPVKYFSNGMKARLAFSIALRSEADILLLDEFFGGVGDLDFQRKSDFAFEKLLENKTILVIGHDRAQVEKYCDRLFFVENGQLIEQQMQKNN